ncbi:3'-5' exoribonuclease [Clostridium sp. D2Q-11]|uniref:3'-5' exoribonuclease n=1 Tax=Anaeromonas frigoriresistens TaxID=2683708 RepID=A0A942Z7A8_9FIRM|nr:exonuclease domain-containing protein [Anaeromonas frigoriresistens]MBS4539361.1 3'-5' exoribonuclease [Anaeromonas frigoriresistens]
MNFTVIDFETANSKRASACSIGIVKVVDGEIVEKKSWLIKPKELEFHSMNIAIHGIRPNDVKEQPEFNELYEKKFRDYFQDELIIAHNASFDMSVLRKTLDLYNIEYPSFNYLCTVKVAQKTWPDLYNHKLDTLSNFLKFKFKHHDALDDCLACANVLINACKKEKANSPLELVDRLGIKVGSVFPKGYSPCSVNRKKVSV